MKVSAILLFSIAFTALAKPAASQNARVNINGSNITVSSFINQIEEQTNYLFVYSKNEIDVNDNVEIESGTKAVSDCLKEAFRNSDVNYAFDNDYIVLTKKDISVAAAQPQDNRISGKITDTATGEPVIGAAVMQKGTSNGVVSDINGHFTISAPQNAVIVISSVGYQTTEVNVGNRDVLDITLSEDVFGLEETVVIAYGTAKRKDFTGSVSSVRLENTPIALSNNTNALESLKGNVSGLDIGASPSAGEEPSMIIRGQKSITGSNEPLLVVDGMIFMGSINDINPNDIETIDVLKDATSAAAYGSRSANGVIMITTKKGRTDKPVITFNASAGVQGWLNKPDLRNAEEQVAASRAVTGVEDLNLIMTDQEYENYKAGRSTNWLDMVTRTGSRQEYQIGLSGAAKRVNYYLSTSYSGDKGIVIGDDFNRISALGKINADITDWLNIGVNASFTKQDYSGVPAAIAWAYNMDPFAQPTRKGSDEMEKYPETSGIGKWHPLWQADESMRTNSDIRNNYRVTASALVKCPWVDGLSYSFNYSVNNTRREETNFINERYYIIEGNYDDDSRYSAQSIQNLLVNANGNINNYNTDSWVMDNIIHYYKTFNKHTLDFTAVATRDCYSYTMNQLSGKDFSGNGNTVLGVYGLSTAGIKEIKQDEYRKANIGYLARGMYSFDDRYFLTASYRRDGSSVFGNNKKWGNFWAAGLAWKISNENLYPQSWKKVLTDMKIKLSWGKNGNQGIDPYGTLSTLVAGKTAGHIYEFGGNNQQYGMKVEALGNSGLGWESTSAWNFGFESNWFNGRLLVDVDGYISQTRDQIFDRTIPSMTGYSSMLSSIGQIENYGAEVTIKSINVRSGDFTWYSGLSFWIPRNKIVHLYGEDLDGDGKEDDDISKGLFIGKPLDAIFGYKQVGVCQVDDTEYINKYEGKPGYPKYEDIDGDGDIDVDDRTIVGYSNYNYRFNLSNTFDYKNFELYFMIGCTLGGGNYYLKSNVNAFSASANSARLDIPWWTEENRSNTYLSPKFVSDSKFLGLQGRDFIRLQDISLTYNFNGALIKNSGINALKVYISGKNLLTFTKWDGEDPETGSDSMNTIPMARIGTIGVNLVF